MTSFRRMTGPTQRAFGGRRMTGPTQRAFAADPRVGAARPGAQSRTDSPMWWRPASRGV